MELADYRTEYRLLGPLEVVHRGEAVPTGGQRKRALLARLLLEANRTVSIDALVDALWGERVPSTAVKMVHIYVSQLRKVLPSGALQTRPPGYRLEVAPEAVDLLAVRAAAQGGSRGAGRRRRRHGGRAPRGGVRALARACARSSSRSRSPRPRPHTSTSSGSSPSRTGSTRNSLSAAIATSRGSCRPSWRATRSASVLAAS